MIILISNSKSCYVWKCYLYYYRRRVPEISPQNLTNFLPGNPNSTAIIASIFMRLHVVYPRLGATAFCVCPLFFTIKIIINNVAFRNVLRCLRCSFRIDVATTLRQIILIARWRNGRCRAECGNVEGSDSEGRC